MLQHAIRLSSLLHHLCPSPLLFYLENCIFTVPPSISRDAHGDSIRSFSARSDPPSKLSITGYEEGKTIDAGTVLKLMCTATSGNPLATLSWYKNDRTVSESALPFTIIQIRGWIVETLLVLCQNSLLPGSDLSRSLPSVGG